jgi:Protein of unknown function (DUF1469).
MPGWTKVFTEAISKALSKAGAKVGIAAGAGTFFGLEWLVNGGLVRSVSGATGMPDWLASLLLSLGVFVIAGMVILYVYKRMGGRDLVDQVKPKPAPKTTTPKKTTTTGGKRK